MNQILTIDGWHPTKLNQMIGRNRHVVGKLKKHDAAVVALEAKMAGIEKATGKRRVGLLIVLGKGQRAGDPDAYWKSLLDALVKCGILIDDNRQNCELGEVRFDRAKPGESKKTIVVLEDIHV